ncbi:MAG TPA: hypothetical protein VMR52_11080 [Dehalococcoidia bacterium]|nr:hypothetical protein [Dehalococcoidia bacterium]
MPDHAWFWAESIAAESVAEGTLVQAFVGDVLCGETRIEERFRFTEPWVGFQKLLVPSESIAPGCGSPGAQVTLVIGDDRQTKEWLAGSIQQIELPAAEGPDEPTSFPALGGPPRENSSSLPSLALLGFLVAGIGLATVAVGWRQGKRDQQMKRGAT